MNGYHTETNSLTEKQLRADIAELEEKAAKGELTGRDANRLRELKAALSNIRGARGMRAW